MNVMDIINNARTVRAASGLHVHWRLPDGSEWSAYASSEEVKARWIEAKAKMGWIYLPERDHDAN